MVNDIDIRKSIMYARTKYLYSEILLHQSISNIIRFLPNFEAFVMMARSTTFTLQKFMNPVTGFEKWYKEKQDVMIQDEIYKFFNDLRVDVTHTKPITHPETVKLSDVEKEIPIIIFQIKTIEPHVTIIKSNLKNYQLTKSILSKYHHELGSGSFDI